MDHISPDSEEVSWFQPVLSSSYMFSPTLFIPPSPNVKVCSVEASRLWGAVVFVPTLRAARFGLMPKRSNAESSLLAPAEPGYRGVGGAGLLCPC